MSQFILSSSLLIHFAPFLYKNLNQNFLSMPPKTKAQQKVEDKTFGLKNKNKSKKVQKYVAQITESVAEP